MAFPKDKLTKAHEQKAHTETSISDAQRAPWQEALDRHVTIPASRSVEAAEVFRGFAGSWAASYEMGLGASTQNAGSLGVPAIQRKTNRLGQPGLPEINFRPYDWGTHRFGPKGPALLGHPISFDIVGPTMKAMHCDWQWRLTPGSGGIGDVIAIDVEAGTDVSSRTPPGPALQTYVQTIVGGPTTMEDYYGFTDLTQFDGGLYMVVSMGGRDGALADPAGFGGLGDGQIGDADPPASREGISPFDPSSKYEIFRIVAMNNVAKSFTLDSAKHIATYFDITGTFPIIRGIMLLRPAATRLVAVPGSGPRGGERVFAVVPPARALGNEYTPPFAFYTAPVGSAGAYDPWVNFAYGPFVSGGAPDTYHYRPLLPIEDPKEQAVGAQADSFGGAIGPPVLLQPPNIELLWESGYKPDEDTSFGRLIRIYEVELIGNAITFEGNPGAGFGALWQADPGFAWIMGYHEIVGEDLDAGQARALHLRRIPEVDPSTGIPFFTPPDAMVAEYAAGANDGIRYKYSFHDAVESLWLDPHASIDKISKARLTNLIDPSWVDHARSMKQAGAEPSTSPWGPHAPDKAIFDTSYSGNGFQNGQNANPGNLMDLGFRMVLFPAKDGGAGHCVPDFSRPIASREVNLDSTKSNEDQWWDVDYSSGLVTLSHTLTAGSDLAPSAVSAIVEPLVVNGPFTFVDNVGGDQITRAAGSWIADGVKVGHRGTISNATNGADNGDFVVENVAALTLTISNGFGGHELTPGVDNTAVITFGDNRRREVVLFASCVPYSREAGQLGSGIRVTAGNTELGNGCGSTEPAANADVFSERRYWRLRGTNASPQVVTSGRHFSIDLEDTLLPTDLPPNGFIEIIQGRDPEGPPAFFDNDRHPVSTFGYEFSGTVSGFGGSVLENCFGGVGVQSITVDDDSHYIAVLRRDLMLPSSATGAVGTSYAHDVTYGSANRATALRFRHATLRKQVDGSVLIEGLEELAEEHEKLFDDLFSSWVIDGFTMTAGAGTTVNIAEGTVLMEGVRSELAASSLVLSAVAGSYYIFLEPQGGDPACPVFNSQIGMPLPTNSCVLVGIGVVSGGVLTTLIDMRKILQDVDLRDVILVGATDHHPTESSHPHFSELADAVQYACEIMRYRAPAPPSSELNADRYVRIRVVGPTNEQASKLPIRFTADGIIIEGTAVKTDGFHLPIGAGIMNQQSVAWSADVPLFDLNGRSNLTFRDLVLEYRDVGQPASVAMGRCAFTNWAGIESTVSGIVIDRVHLINYQEDVTGPPPNIAHAFVWFTEGDAINWKIRNCAIDASDAGIYFGGNNTRGNTTDTLADIWIENNIISGRWQAGNNWDHVSNGIQHLLGLNTLGDPEVHGGVVLISTTGATGCVVRGNHITNWPGVGICDTGAEDCLYEGNTIQLTGDVGIWTGNTNLGIAPLGEKNRVVNNVVDRVHGLALAGGVGTRNMVGEAGIPWAQKRAIYVHSVTNTIVADNYVETQAPDVTRDASIYVGEELCSLIGNICKEGVVAEADATDLVIANGQYPGVLDLSGPRTVVSGCQVGTSVAIDGTDSVLIGCYIGRTITITGAETVVCGNFVADATPSLGVVFGARNTVIGNLFMAPDATGDVEVPGDSCLVVGNYIQTYLSVGTSGTPSFDTVIANNRIVSGVDTLAAIPNYGGGAANFFASITLHGDHHVVIGNVCTKGINIPASTSENNVISGNVFGSGGVNDNGSSRFFGNNAVVSGNHFFDGTGQNVSFLLGGTGITFTGNHCDEGHIHTQAASNVISSNIINGSPGGILVDGDFTAVVGNRLLNSAHNIRLGFNGVDGDDCTVVANVVGDNIDLGYTGSGGSRSTVVGNWVGDDITTSDVIADITIQGNRIQGSLSLFAPRCTVSGNNIDETMSVGPLANDCAITGNTVQNTGVAGTAVQIDGEKCVITGNRFYQCDVGIGGNGPGQPNGDFTIFSNNYIEGAGKGNLIVRGTDCLIDGNWIDGVLTASPAVSNGPADRISIRNNTIGNTLTCEDIADYVIIGNKVSGDIIISAGAGATDVGIIIGNHVSGYITDTPAAAGGAIPTSGVVALGNKVGGNNAIFSIDPGADSVGAGAANALADFNVKG